MNEQSWTEADKAVAREYVAAHPPYDAERVMELEARVAELEAERDELADAIVQWWDYDNDALLSPLMEDRGDQLRNWGSWHMVREAQTDE